ncbi:DUF1702 family protein [Saccharothrix hoggarensis]|uniref:DUF1702 family protein n=1 Tax=Saccharothrix hoggarensis TaxID=913853 RepID=A0ABW3R4E4_9PSEU
MAGLTGALRKVLLAPSFASVRFAERGFQAAPGPTSTRLEAVPQAVVAGFEWGVEAPPAWELEARLEMVEPELRGFAYEGATMACTVLDVMPGGRRDRTAELLRGPGLPHLFLCYIGIGFAMARLPRPLWKKVLPDLDGVPHHPVMSWLAVDGYGFDRAYFETRRWVDEQREFEPYPWLGAPDYFPRAADQGVGRALWFIHGADPAAVAEAVRRFPERRQPDLWSGVGLAATFAGGCDRVGLTRLREAAGEHHDELALGSVFAVKGRAHSGFVPTHAVDAAAALTDLTVADALDLADRTEPGGDAGATPAYEVWRNAIRESFTVRERRLSA